MNGAIANKYKKKTFMNVDLCMPQPTSQPGRTMCMR